MGDEHAATDQHAAEEPAPETAEQRQARHRQHQDHSYQKLAAKLQAEIQHATTHHDAAALAESETALTSAHRDYQRVLRNRADPNHPPF